MKLTQQPKSFYNVYFISLIILIVNFIMSLRSDKEMVVPNIHCSSDDVLLYASPITTEDDNDVVVHSSSPVAMIKQALESGSINNFPLKNTDLLKKEKGTPLSPELISPFQKLDIICQSPVLKNGMKNIPSPNPSIVTQATDVDESPTLKESQITSSIDISASSDSKDDNQMAFEEESVDISDYYTDETGSISSIHSEVPKNLSEFSLNSYGFLII